MLTKERFDTVTDDGVEIVGDYYPPPPAKGKNAPVVLLLHAVGPQRINASRKDWEKFPEQLQSKGYAVIAFDFRGYGDSTKITKPEKYWQVPAAGLLGPHVPKRSFPAKNPPIKIDLRDYGSPTELAQLGNDLIAIKRWAHYKNDASELNSGNMIVIGAEQGAVIGALWAYNEFVMPTRQRGPGKWEGEDISCVVWLSLQPFLGNSNIESATLKKCLMAMKDKFPTLAMYGDTDNMRRNFWNRALEWIKPQDQSERFKGTGVWPIKGTNLAGTKLLGNEAFGSEKTIIDYIEKYKNDNLWRGMKVNDQPALFVTAHLNLPR